MEFRNIEAERVRLGKTKARISVDLGISERTYTAYVRGETPIPSTILLTMARLFNCSTDYLLGLNASQQSA